MPIVSQVLAGLLLAALLAAGVQTWRVQSLKTDLAELKTASAEENRLRERAARIDQTNVAAATRKATDVFFDRKQAAAANTALVGNGLRGVLDAAASADRAAPSSATCRPDAERILRGLLAEGAALAAEGEGRLGGAVSKLDGLQSFNRSLSP